MREIGRGGIGIVYEGWDGRLSRAVVRRLLARAQQGHEVALQAFTAANGHRLLGV